MHQSQARLPICLLRTGVRLLRRCLLQAHEVNAIIYLLIYFYQHPPHGVFMFPFNPRPVGLWRVTHSVGGGAFRPPSL